VLLQGDFPMRAVRWIGLFGALIAFAMAPAWGAEPQSLDPMLEPYLTEFGLPAIAAAVFQNGTIVASGAVGTRRAGTHIPVTINDRFHIGSDSKAFTATLAGQFVQEGKLRWDATPADVFPELKAGMNGEFAKIRLDQLLSHSSGLSDKALIDLVYRSFQQDGNMNDVRYWMVKETASKPLDHARGSRFDYCNLGYVIAGAMLERVGHKSWEELVEERIFQPMELKTAGFGPQSSMGKVDAPLGHVLVNGKAKAMLAGPNGDNPLILGPAGTIHMSVLDFAKWVAWNAGEGKRGPALVSAETLKKLHTPLISTGARDDAAPGTPKTGGYAMGWGTLQESWAAAPAVTHTGSNQMNLATAMFWPGTDFGFVMMTNIGGQPSDAALRKLAAELYKRFGAK
jgi:CubicO group peptidase (beta-lactamase class C family)